MKLLLVLGASPFARKLDDAAGRAGWTLVPLASATGLVLAIEAERPDAVVYAVEEVDVDFSERATRQHRGLALVAVAPIAASDRAAMELERGARDVLATGIGVREVVARIELAVRRGSQANAQHGGLQLDALRIDAAGEVSFADGPIELTARERAILEVLLESPGSPVAREVVYRRVWGYTMARGDRIVDVNVKRLRGKLAAVAGDRIELFTRQGVGYGIRAAQPAPATVTS